MDYTLEGTGAMAYGRSFALGALFGESTGYGNSLAADREANLLAMIFGVGPTRPHKDYPDLITTLKDPEFEVPGGEEVRRYWLEGAQAICATFKQLARCNLSPRLCRCRFGINDDASVSLDVAVHMPLVRAQVSEGDEVNQGALTVMKLEDGTFHASTSPRIYRVVCANGASRFDRLGHASWSKIPTVESVRDLIETELRHCLFDSESFAREVELLREADGEFVADPDQLLQWAEAKADIALAPPARLRALREFSRSERRTRWDLLNAVTAQAHYAPDAKGAREFELLGGLIAEHRLGIPARRRSRPSRVVQRNRAASEICA